MFFEDHELFFSSLRTCFSSADFKIFLYVLVFIKGTTLFLGVALFIVVSLGSVVSIRESQGWQSLVGCYLRGHTESGSHTEVT